MSPPESTVTGTGNIFDRISLRVVISMVRDPRVWRSRSIEHGGSDEELLDNRVELHSPMCKRAVIRHRRAQCAHAGETKAAQKDFPSWNREQRDSDESENVDCQDVHKSPRILSFGFPPWKRPWMTFGKILRLCLFNHCPPHFPT